MILRAPCRTSWSSPFTVLQRSVPDKGKGILYSKATKSQPLEISPPRDRPHTPRKIYKDCVDCISKLWLEPIQILVDLDDPCVCSVGKPFLKVEDAIRLLHPTMLDFVALNLLM
ncbi:hypothetical protein L3X38_042828 [Prunus dulcis]|uniref:Uncharacterized protein n=1 Tax=Prunus dulcis TaxID=3755 RepID=A0AAD4UXP4_PRUDU|nr:hypothetical protein L3X38_042828 [Prunus dulcis]